MKIDIKKVEEMRKEGKSLPVIGKYFDVSKSLVSLICQSFGNRGVKIELEYAEKYLALIQNIAKARV